jgi:RNA polymerase sigma-70 factor (ECF subfamily)
MTRKNTDPPMALALVKSGERPGDGPSTVDPDTAWVTRARAGDQGAFAELFRAHHGRIHAMCTRLLGGAGAHGRSDGDIDDAVQQTFLEAWRCLHRFEGKSRFTTWLTRIAIHTCFSVRRRLRRLFLANDEAHGLLLVEPARADDNRVAAAPLAPDEAASRHARARALEEVLAQLAPKKRVVFVLADLEELSSPEIAAIVGIPEATVRTRLYYARRELASLLRNHPGFADVDAVHRGGDNDADISTDGDTRTPRGDVR